MKIVESGTNEFRGLCQKAVDGLPQATIFYTVLQLDYQRYYLQDKLIKDLSFFLLQDTGEYGAFVPLYLCSGGEGKEFSYGGDYLRAPLIFVPETTGARSKVELSVFEQIESLAKREGAVQHKAAIEPFEFISQAALCNYLRKYGYRDFSTSTQIIQLAKPHEELWSAIRKSYRPLINRGRQKFKTVILDEFSADLSAFEEYPKLHRLAAGRQTRPIETFQKMQELLKVGHAFLIGIVGENDQWVGSYLFYRYHGHVYYSSSALHPEADPHDGISHLGLWTAVEYSKKREDRYFDLGWQPFPDEADFSEKTDAIAMFKRGFGGSRVVWFRGVKRFTC